MSQSIKNEHSNVYQKESYEDKWEKINLACKLSRFWSGKAIMNMKIKMWKTKPGVNTKIPWGWLLLKATACRDEGGLQSLLPVIKLLKSGVVSFADSAAFMQWAKVMLRSTLLRRSLLLSSTWTRRAGDALPCNLTGSWQLPLGTGVCSRGNLCYALPSTVSLLKLRRETEA